MEDNTVIYLRTDQYTHVSQNCPMRVDMHPADDVVEISLGEHRIAGDTLRLVVDHPDTCLLLMETLRDARHRLTEHLRVKTCPDPAMSRLATQF
jgi:hypothetical protein